MHYKIFLIPFISAFIGWLANRIAIKMLFHPQRPKKLFWLSLQGIIPKKQRQIAEKLGKLVSTELLSFRDIEQKIAEPASFQKIMPQVEGHIDEFLRVSLPKKMPVISMFIGDKTIQELKAVFIAELEILFPVIMEKYVHNFKEDLNLEKMVIDKIAGLSAAKLEKNLNASLAKELRLVGITGAILGFVVGLLEVFVGLL